MRWTVEGNWPSIDELRAFRLGLIEDGVLTPQTKALIDVRMAATVPSYEDVGKIVRAALNDGGLPLVRAYLVGSALQHGLMRQFQAVADGSAVKLAIFTQEAEARRWLQTQSASTG